MLDEEFHELFIHARMLEEHKKQFTVSAKRQHEYKENSGGNSQSQSKPGHKKSLPNQVPSRKSPEEEPEVRE